MNISKKKIQETLLIKFQNFYESNLKNVKALYADKNFKKGFE